LADLLLDEEALALLAESSSSSSWRWRFMVDEAREIGLDVDAAAATGLLEAAATAELAAARFGAELMRS
jgi:hypothetical protein